MKSREDFGDFTISAQNDVLIFVFLQKYRPRRNGVHSFFKNLASSVFDRRMSEKKRKQNNRVSNIRPLSRFLIINRKIVEKAEIVACQLGCGDCGVRGVVEFNFHFFAENRHLQLDFPVGFGDAKEFGVEIRNEIFKLHWQVKNLVFAFFYVVRHGKNEMCFGTRLSEHLKK